MKIGIILFIIGAAVILYLARAKFDKAVIKNVGIFIAVVLMMYGLILIVQPSEDKYFDYTKSTISNSSDIKK